MRAPLSAVALALAANVALPVRLLAEEHVGIASTTDPVSQGIVAVVIVALFVALTREAAHRVLIVFGAAAFVWLLTYLSPYHLVSFEAAWQHVDINVLLLLASMMAVVGVLKATGFFAWAVAMLMNRAAGEPKRVQHLVLWFTGVASALLDNVTTVIFVTPMAGAMAKKLRINPVVILLPMVIASNVGGTATLIGDPPNIMIGSGANLSFVDFIRALAGPVVLMMVGIQWLSKRFYRTELDESARSEAWVPLVVPQPTDPVLLRWLAVICTFILVGFLTHAMTGMPPSVPAMIGAAAALIVQDRLYLRKNKPTEHERAHGILTIIEHEIEWPTLAFFFFLFIIVGAAVETGLISSVAHGLEWAIGAGRDALSLGDTGTLMLAALLLLWASAFLSAFIDNIPYVAVTIPIVHELTKALPGETQVLWWALALGACLGGNGTAVGASANVTTLGLAEKDGTRIGFKEFMGFGMPAMILTVTIASACLAVHVFLGEHRADIVIWIVALPVLVLAMRAGGPSRNAEPVAS